jgi:hypothetical protein
MKNEDENRNEEKSYYAGLDLELPEDERPQNKRQRQLIQEKRRRGDSHQRQPTDLVEEFQQAGHRRKRRRVRSPVGGGGGGTGRSRIWGVPDEEESTSPSCTPSGSTSSQELEDDESVEEESLYEDGDGRSVEEEVLDYDMSDMNDVLAKEHGLKPLFGGKKQHSVASVFGYRFWIFINNADLGTRETTR